MSTFMIDQRKKIVAGNWKMNGTISSLEQISILNTLIKNDTCEVIVCPPTTLITEAIKTAKGGPIKIGSQNCHEKGSGAYTGEVSPTMLFDLGVEFVILGHSERRLNNYETSEVVQKRAKAAHQTNLITIICIGESEAQKDSGQTMNVVREQLTQSLPSTANHLNTVIAYEPIWAIGSGKTAKIDDIKQVHNTLRNHVAVMQTSSMASKIRIIYGGSVNSENCFEILHTEDVDGALVGGASLIAKNFSTIINSII